VVKNFFLKDIKNFRGHNVTIDKTAILESEIALAVLDGATIDEGVAFELGFAYSKGKPCYGLQTDIRRLRNFINNPMIECSVSHIFSNTDDLMTWTKKHVQCVNKELSKCKV